MIEIKSEVRLSYYSQSRHSLLLPSNPGLVIFSTLYILFTLGLHHYSDHNFCFQTLPLEKLTAAFKACMLR